MPNPARPRVKRRGPAWAWLRSILTLPAIELAIQGILSAPTAPRAREIARVAIAKAPAAAPYAIANAPRTRPWKERPTLPIQGHPSSSVPHASDMLSIALVTLDPAIAHVAEDLLPSRSLARLIKPTGGNFSQCAVPSTGGFVHLTRSWPIRCVRSFSRSPGAHRCEQKYLQPTVAASRSFVS